MDIAEDLLAEFDIIPQPAVVVGIDEVSFVVVFVGNLHTALDIALLVEELDTKSLVVNTVAPCLP